jgi:hypothetical protein
MPSRGLSMEYAKDWKHELKQSRVTIDDFLQNFEEIVETFEKPKLNSLQEYMHLMYNMYDPKEEIRMAVDLNMMPWLRLGNRPKKIDLIISLHDKEELFELLK